MICLLQKFLRLFYRLKQAQELNSRCELRMIMVFYHNEWINPSPLKIDKTGKYSCIKILKCGGAAVSIQPPLTVLLSELIRKYRV